MKIPIQNIYFLLCYAWNTLAEGRVVSVTQEECKTLADLFARVLDGGVTHLLKRGLDRGYVTEEMDTSSLRGKLDISTTIKRQLLLRCRVHCVIDSLSYDVTHNQIIKTTIRNLVQCEDLDRDLRDRFLRLYRRLHEVSEIELSSSAFASVQLHRNNAFYGFLLQICRLIYDNLLIDEQAGESKFRDFLRNERQMAAVFEKFVRNFYRREQAEYRVKSERIDWQEVEATQFDRRFLPSMRTDISLESPHRKIVIDTKYYVSTLQSHYESETVHSGNLYQLFTYLKNLQIGEHRQVEGILLYPTVGKSLNLQYRIQGHSIRVVTVDLDADWRTIHERLLGLISKRSIDPSTDSRSPVAN